MSETPEAEVRRGRIARVHGDLSTQSAHAGLAAVEFAS
jgi:hypothetical protein